MIASFDWFYELPADVVLTACAALLVAFAIVQRAALQERVR